MRCFTGKLSRSLTLSAGVVVLLAAACGGSGTTNSGGSVSASDVAAAKARVADLKMPQTHWLGPTTGPTLATGKKIVVICSALSAWEERVCADAQALGNLIGWQVTAIQQPSTDLSGVTTLNQAIALHPDGILTANPVDTAQGAVVNAVAAGIPIVGTHATGTGGADPSLHLFADVQPDPQLVAKAFLDWAIADSGGNPRFVVLYTSVARVPRMKGEAFGAAIKACTSCTLLESDDRLDAFLSGGAAGELMTTWVQKYGSQPFYGMTISDDGWNAMIPTLRNASVPKGNVRLMATDGSVSAYDRIRHGDYQVMTAPDPDQEQVYILFDELNRAFHNQPATNFQPRYYLVDKSNIDLAGGTQDVYTPPDGFVEQYLKIWGLR